MSNLHDDDIDDRGRRRQRPAVRGRGCRRGRGGRGRADDSDHADGSDDSDADDATPGLRTPASSLIATGRRRSQRCVEPVSSPRSSSPSTGSGCRSSSRAAAAPSFDDLVSERRSRAARLLGRPCATPAFRLVKAGEQLRLRDHADRHPVAAASRSPASADPGAVAAAFADGATIVAQGLHHWWPPIARFCRNLEAELGHPAQANAYWTPRDSQGLPVHHDTHDVFVLQIAGEKRWLVYEPVLELPLKDQRYSQGARRARRDRPRRRPAGRRHALSPARLAPSGDDVGDRFAPPDRRRERLHLDRRAEGGAPGCGERGRAAALGARRRRGRRGAGGSCWRPGSIPSRSCGGCGASFIISRRPILADRISELRALDDLGPDTRGRAAPNGDRRPARPARRVDRARVRGQADRVSRARARGDRGARARRRAAHACGPPGRARRGEPARPCRAGSSARGSSTAQPETTRWRDHRAVERRASGRRSRT